MTLHFVTSAQDGPHIKSSDDARAYAGLFGNGAYVFKTGDKMSASMVDSNTMRILEGDSLFCGHKWNIRNFEDITIENGTPGLKRIDLVVAHFETSPKEELTLVVYKGVEVEEGDPVVPTHITGDLNMGDTVAEMPLYTVSLNGLTVGTPSQQFVVVDDLYGDWLLNATKALFGVTDDKKIPGSALAPHSVGQQQLETSVWDSVSQTREVTISSTEIAANNGNLVRTDLPAIAGYKAVGVVGMKIGMNLYTMYFGLENNNTRLRCDFLNRASTAFSGSPGVATILYLKNG